MTATKIIPKSSFARFLKENSHRYMQIYVSADYHNADAQRKTRVFSSVLTSAALEMQKLNMHMKTPLSSGQVVLMHDKDAFTLTGTD